MSTFSLSGTKVRQCHYGENAWQTPAALFSTDTDDPLALDKFELVAGTDPSYNNWCDADRLLQTMTHVAATFNVNRGKVPYIALGCKHGNMCGAAFGKDRRDVVRKMISGDPRAMFGGLVMTNFAVDTAIGEELLTHRSGNVRRILDGVIAPGFSSAAIGALKRKEDKCRFLANLALANLSQASLDTASRFRPVRGGFLRQPNYTFVLDFNDDQLVRHGRKLPNYRQNDVLLAWAVGSTSNSNTVTLVRCGMLIGNGTGQQDRVSACKLALHKAREAGHAVKDSVACSDSFFPFADGPEVLIGAGVGTIFASSGSIRDAEVVECCDLRGVSLWLIPDKCGRGFYGH